MNQHVNGMNRREFLLYSSAGLAVGLSWIYGGEIALGQVRWEDEKESVLLADDPALGLSRKHILRPDQRNHSPKLAFDSRGLLWLAWVSERDRQDGVYLSSFDGAQFGDEIRVSREGVHAFQPAILAVPTLKPNNTRGLSLAWTEFRERRWQVCRNFFSIPNNEFQRRPMEFPGMNPALATDTAMTFPGCMAMETPAAGKASEGTVIARWDDVSPPSHSLQLSPDESKGARRPAVASDSEGRTWFAWDQEEGPGHRAVYIRCAEWHREADGALRPRLQDPIRVTWHPALNIAPSITVDAKNRVWIAWQSNRRGNDRWDIPRWIYMRCWDGERFLDPVSPPKAMNLDKEGTDQSFEFPRIHALPDGKILVTGRPSHNFCLQYYHGNEWSPLFRLPEDGWGGRGQFLDAALAPDGSLYVARRDINVCVLQRITGIVDASLTGNPREPELVESREKDEAAPRLVNIVKAPLRWDPIDDAEGVTDPLYAYYGDLHGHTWTSDGVGDLDEYFIHRRDYYQDDFGALTDHDSFVGRPISPAQWEHQKEVMQQYHEDERFVTLFAQEWTTGRYPGQAGHKCIYSTNPHVPLFDHSFEEYATTQSLYAELKKWGCLVFPHHTGWTGTDWENLDPEVQTLAEIVSNHGVFEHMGNRPIPHRGGARGCFIQDGLARGLRFGLIGGSDSHGLLWHHRAGWKRDCNRTGLAVVLAPALTRTEVFRALRERRTYATTGIKPRLDFRVDNHLMGSEFETTAGRVGIRVHIAARERVKWVTIVKDNVDWYQYGGEGFTTRVSVSDNDLEPGTHYYYARVEFEGPDMAWSSPVWVTRT